MIDSPALLRHARELVGPGRGRPSEVNLRRGISAAYYAVFHHVTKLAVDHVLGAAPPEVKAKVRRSWSHGELASTAAMIVDRAAVLANNPAAPVKKDQAEWGPLVDLAACDHDTVEACRRFVELQKQRHAADYDHLATFDKATLLSACQDAEHAMTSMQSAAAPARQAFLTMVVVRRKDLRERDG